MESSIQQIHVDETMARVNHPTGNLVETLEELLSFDDPAQKFINVGGKVRIRSNQKKIRLFNIIDATFPAGLLPEVCRQLTERGIAYKVTEHLNLANDTGCPTEWLRPEQLHAVGRAICRRRGILWMPTGSGKTEVAIALALRIQTKWLFIVHKKDLLHQTAERYYKRTGEKAGKIGDGCFDMQRFTVATFQTLARGMRLGDKCTFDLLESVCGLIVDESHTLPADTFWNVAMACVNAPYRIGLSGTPLARGDGKAIYSIAALGPVILRIHPNTLIEAGLLAKPIIHMPELRHTPTKKTWQGVYSECITKSKKRNALLIACAKLSEKPALLFVREIKHGQILDKQLRKAGISCEFLSGKKQTPIRDAAVKRLVKGDIDVLVVTVIFQEGIDIPSLRSVIIGSSGKSAVAAVQRVGRGMRIYDGKSSFHVYDVNDRGHRNLDRWSRERCKAYKAEGYEVVDHINEKHGQETIIFGN